MLELLLLQHAEQEIHIDTQREQIEQTFLEQRGQLYAIETAYTLPALVPPPAFSTDHPLRHVHKPYRCRAIARDAHILPLATLPMDYE